MKTKIAKYFKIGFLVWLVAVGFCTICIASIVDVRDYIKDLQKKNKIILILSLPMYILAWPAMIVIFVYRVVRSIVTIVTYRKKNKEEKEA